MEHTAPAILEIGIVLLVAAGAGWLARAAGLPAVVGYLAVGLVVSPFTPGYVANREQIQLLADFGVVILLFEVGIEVDLLRLRREQVGLLWAAPLQVVLTTMVAGGAAFALGLDWFGAAIVGLSVALSSGVVIVNITRSRRRTTDPVTDRTLLGWSVLQDVTGVALAGVILALGSGARPPSLALAGIALFGALAVVVAWLLPRLLRSLREQHDLFLIVTVATGLAVAGVGSVVFAVPLALAAFVSGLAIAESPDAAEARRRLLPFRDLFAVLFFVAIGTLIDPTALSAGMSWLVLLLLSLVVGKILVVYALARLAGLPAHPWQLAIGLGQLGEFGFVLASVALAAHAIGADVHAAILAAVAVSIAISTVAVRLVRRAEPAPA
jgi:CPA2 family monovalent cation:H+ antiporter-2